MRLKAKGMVPNKAIGMTFPGVSRNDIAAALRNRRRASKAIPEPKMSIGPIESNGKIKVDFN
jgi:hypothetical protein